MALERLEQSLAVATADRQAAEQAREGRSDALKAVRLQVRELAGELDRVVDSAHGAEIVRAEHRMRLEQIAVRAVEEFGVDAAALVAEYGPDVPVPAPAQEAGEPSPAASRPAASLRRRRTAAARRAPPSPTSGPSRSSAPPWRSASSISSAR